MTSEQIVVRAARLEESGAIESMQVRSILELNSRDYSEAQIDGFLTYLGPFDPRMIHAGSLYVAVCAGRIVGSAGWTRTATEIRRHCRGLEDLGTGAGGDDDRIDVRAVFVHPGWTRRGIGRRLMTQVESRAQSAGFRFADVIATVTGAPLYRALGYLELARPRVELPNGLALSACFLSKRL